MVMHPKFLERLNVNLKVKTSEEGIGVRSLACSTSGVKRERWSPGMETRTNDKWVNYSNGLTQTKQQVS
jgi:hypothetical protein